MDPWKLDKFLRAFNQGWPRTYDSLQATHGFLGAAAFIGLGLRPSSYSEWAALSAAISFSLSLTTICLLSAVRRLMFHIHDVFKYCSDYGVMEKSPQNRDVKRFPSKYNEQLHNRIWLRRTISYMWYRIIVVTTVLSIGWLTVSVILILWGSVSSGKYGTTTGALVFSWAVGSMLILLPDQLDLWRENGPGTLFRITPLPQLLEKASTVPPLAFHPGWLCTETCVVAC